MLSDESYIQYTNGHKKKYGGRSCLCPSKIAAWMYSLYSHVSTLLMDDLVYSINVGSIIG
jgi:hypothetical protein